MLDLNMEENHIKVDADMTTKMKNLGVLQNKKMMAALTLGNTVQMRIKEIMMVLISISFFLPLMVRIYVKRTTA